MKRNIPHSNCLIKDNIVTCVHRYNDSPKKNWCELINSECHNGMWSEQRCGLTIYINKLQRIHGVK